MPKKKAKVSKTTKNTKTLSKAKKKASASKASKTTKTTKVSKKKVAAKAPVAKKKVAKKASSMRKKVTKVTTKSSPSKASSAKKKVVAKKVATQATPKKKMSMPAKKDIQEETILASNQTETPVQSSREERPSLVGSLVEQIISESKVPASEKKASKESEKEELEVKATEKDDVAEDDDDEPLMETKGKSSSGPSLKQLEEEVEIVDDSLSNDQKDAAQTKMRELGEKIIEEVEVLREDYTMEDIQAAIQDLDLFNNNDSDECNEKYCENLQQIASYCRLHYIKNWNVIKKKQAILKEGKLQSYIEELVNKYPTKYIESILSDLSNEKQFFETLRDLNIETAYNFDDSSDDMEDDDIDIETKAYSSSSRNSNYDDEESL